jgi:hypothetical protein
MRSLGLSVPVVVGPWYGGARVRWLIGGQRAGEEKGHPA